MFLWIARNSKPILKFPEEACPDAIERLRQKGLIEVKDDIIRLSSKGDPWRFNIAWEFFDNKSQN